MVKDERSVIDCNHQSFTTEPSMDKPFQRIW